MSRCPVLILMAVFACFQAVAQYTPVSQYILEREGDAVINHGVAFPERKCLVFTGYIRDKFVRDNDLWLFSTDLMGNMAWEKKLEGVRSETGDAICTAPGGFLVATTIAGHDGRGIDARVLLADFKGNTRWSTPFSTPDNEQITMVTPLVDSSFAGVGNRYNGKENFLWMFRLNYRGEVLWEKSLGGLTRERGVAIQQTADGNILVLGQTCKTGKGRADFWLIKYTPDGQMIWEKTYGGDKADIPTAMLLLPSGDIVLAGTTESGQCHGGTDICLLFLDHEGNLRKTKTFGRGENDSPQSLLLTEDGKLFLTGFSSMSLTMSDFLAMELSADGDILWHETYGDFRDDEANVAFEISSGNFLLGGVRKVEPGFSKTGWLLRLSADPATNNELKHLVTDNPGLNELVSGEHITGPLDLNTLVVVIGIENYKNVPQAQYALNDVRYFDYTMRNVLGIPERNIYLLTNENATYDNITGLFGEDGWLEENLTPETNLIVYYSGHGMPVFPKYVPALVPYDSDPQYSIDRWIPMDYLFDLTRRLNPAHVTFFVDACFSGINRSDSRMLFGQRGLIRTRKSHLPSKRMDYLSATDFATFSTADTLARQGLFTYHLLRGLQGRADHDRNHAITMNELLYFIELEVLKSGNELQKKQLPQFTGKGSHIFFSY